MSNSMKFIIAITLFVLVISSGVVYLKRSPKMQDNATSIPIVATTSQQQVSIPTTPELTVDPSVAKKGDVVGDLTIKSISVSRYPNGSYEGIDIQFNGEATVEGIMGYDEMLGVPCIDVGNEGGKALPSVITGQQLEKVFCLTGELTKTLPPELLSYNPSVQSTRYKANITVKDYRFISVPKEAGSLAVLLKINSISVVPKEKAISMIVVGPVTDSVFRIDMDGGFDFVDKDKKRWMVNSKDALFEEYSSSQGKATGNSRVNSTLSKWLEGQRWVGNEQETLSGAPGTVTITGTYDNQILYASKVVVNGQ